jgi:hypothetical protein
MRSLKLSLAAAVLTLFAAVPASAVLYRGAKVTLMLPDGIRFDKGKFMLMTTNVADVSDDGHGGVRVGLADWPADQLVHPRECTAVGPHVLKKDNRVRLILNCGALPQFHFFVAGLDEPAALELFHRFVAVGGPADTAARTLAEKSAARVAEAVFTGDLASVAPEKRLAVMKAAAGFGAGTMKRTLYRDAPYLDVDLGDHENVFNTIQMDRTQRVARVTSEKLIPAARKLEETLSGVDAIAGVALTIAVHYQNFVNPTNGESGVDKLELLVPRAELTKLLRDEITGQQLLANSVVRLNGSRVDVDLSRG